MTTKTVRPAILLPGMEIIEKGRTAAIVQTVQHEACSKGGTHVKTAANQQWCYDRSAEVEVTAHG